MCICLNLCISKVCAYQSPTSWLVLLFIWFHIDLNLVYTLSFLMLCLLNIQAGNSIPQVTRVCLVGLCCIGNISNSILISSEVYGSQPSFHRSLTSEQISFMLVLYVGSITFDIPSGWYSRLFNYVHIYRSIYRLSVWISY